MAALLPFSEVARLDAELVRLGRGASAVRLAVGVALDRLSASGGHHELGFSSLEAYARERCERTGRWAADSRALAQKLESLPRTREALESGDIGWSIAELLARHVTAENEGKWLERAREATVRELRVLLGRAHAGEAMASKEATADDVDADAEVTRTLTVSATREDGWLFECARKVAEAVAGPMPPDRLLHTLLAEGYSSLLELVPESARAELDDLEGLEREAATESLARAAWRAELRRWQSEADEICEARLPLLVECAVSTTRASGQPGSAETDGAKRLPSETPEALDRELRRLCAELAERDLALGMITESARKLDVWRRLGFASESQYARERVGVSLSSLKQKRILAARAGRVPELATALSSGRIGYEAAYLLSRVVTPKTAKAWIFRAERRTVKHLREEVEAAELLMRIGLERDGLPLDERSLDELFELERSIVSGEWVASGEWVGRTRDSWAGVGTKSKASDGAVSESDGADGVQRDASQMSGAGSAAGQMSGAVSAGQASGIRRAARLAQRFGRVTLRWVVKGETARFWHALERAFARVSSRGCRLPSSFLRFLCENFCRIWLVALGRECLTESGELPEYFGVYRRDAFRCTSPVCTRRDVTPHHLKFRSHGGGDDDENVASLCVFCHLRGVHEGRIAAEPPASRIRWRIGRTGTVRVAGRTRVVC